jgi:formylglycine-generating enzyme required for sulfatase activity/CheY-like chemotaxis protein
MRILLVDDETSVLQALLTTLKTLPGHDVRVATNGGKAIENASAMGGVDILITDVVMEPMDGFTLREHLAGKYPRMRTIFVTGYDLSDYPEQTQGHQLLQKPVDAPGLLAAVQAEIQQLAAPVPAAVPVRAAQPVAVAAVPKAQPAAQPVARPAAQPAARPAAQPVAKPAAQPVARAVPQPAARPAAQPVAVAAARAAVPVARAVPASPSVSVAPIAAAAPAAAPAARGPSTQPVAAATSTAAFSAPAPPAVVTAPAAGAPSEILSGSGESLLGQTLGAYQIVSYLGDGRMGSAYAAVQISINRPVGLKVLNPDRAADQASKAQFIADARAKAHVQHPSILAVYEAGESQGRFFYAREYVDGQSLADFSHGQRLLEENTAIKVMRTVAEGMVYLHMNNIPHRALDATKIFVGVDGIPRLANLAVQVADEHLSVEQEIQTLGRMLYPICVSQNSKPAFTTLLTRLVQAPESGITAWGQVIQAAKALEPKVVPVEAAKISAQDRAAIEAVELARKQQRRGFWLNVGSLTLLFSIVVFLAVKKFVLSNERSIQKMVKIPAGTYQLAGGKTATIESDFWIDKYEVTWAQYARFLEYLDRNPTADQDFRHPRMPRYLEHKLKHWDIFYGQARVSGKAAGIPIDLNCPVMNVTWWDAYAYAKWLGQKTGTDRDLPTADEWAVAASGAEGYKYPWGNEFEAKKANTNADFKPRQPGAKGDVDGYNHWSPVDAISGDRSPFGVMGMAGNVAEWTASWTPDNRFPILKGGSFATKALGNDAEKADADPSTPQEWIGFRTISRTPPPDAE